MTDSPSPGIAAAPAGPDAGAPAKSPARSPWRRGWRAWVLRLGLYPPVIYAALIVGLIMIEGSFIYYPTKYPIGDWDPRALHLQAEDVWFAAADGVRLHGWWAPGYDAHVKPDAQAPVLIWCHGNAGNLTYRGEPQADFQACGLTTLNWDYRGYGKSEGEPNEQGLYRDADAAYEYVVREKKVDPGRLVLYGQSLGAAVALDLAVRKPCAGLVLEAPFTNIPEAGHKVFPFLPLTWIVRQRFDNLAKIGGLKVPLLLFHGDRDEIIPYALGRKLFDAAPQPKTMFTIAGAGHNDVAYVDAQYYRRVKDFALQVMKEPGGH